MEPEIKNNVELFTFCNGLPKTELHAHLNGSIRRSTLFELSTEEDRLALEVLYKNHMDFDNAMNFFKISSKILTSLDIISRITREMIEDWNNQNCMYLEIRSTVRAMAGKTKEDYMRTLLNEIKEGNSKYQMVTRFIISLNRESSIEDFLDTLEVYKNFNDDTKSLIVGIDYCGNENNKRHKLDDIYIIFQNFRDAGLKVTFHSGEVKDYEMPDFSKFKPDRISHTFFYTDEDFKKVITNRIPIEVCPTCSYLIKRETNFENIPFKNYHKMDHEGQEYDLYCFNTDDTMLMMTDLSQEYFEVSRSFNMTKEDLKNVILKTIDFIFETDEGIRNRLRDKINNYRA